MRNFKSLLAVAFSEIKTRSSLLGASLVMSIFPILFCFLGKTFKLTTNYDDIGLVAYAIMLCCATGFSVILGSSMLGNELTSRRMSFYFTRPLSSVTIWGGKVLGALSIIIGGSIITVLPSLLFSISHFKQSFTSDMVINYSAIVLFFLGLGLVAGIVFRSKSFFLGLDLALVPVVIILGGLVFWRIIVYYNGSYFLQQVGFSRNFDAFAFVIALVGLVMIVGSGIGLVVGRTDIKQVHRALSFSLWGLLSFVLLGGFSISQWIVSASPKDLTSLSESSILPGEKWAIFSGQAWGRGAYTPTFLFNLKTQSYVSLPNEVRTYISGDGTKAIWLEEKGLLEKEYQLVKVNLTSDEAKPVHTNISFPNPGEWQLSKDGSLAVTARKTLVSVFDINQDKEIATVNVPESNGSWPYKMVFLSSEKVRIYYNKQEKSNQNVSIVDFDIPSKKATLEGKFTTPGYFVFGVTENAEAVILSTKEILNGKTGELIAKLPVKEDASVTAKFISADKVALVESNITGSTLKIFSLDKNLVEQTISLGKAQSAYVTGKLSDDVLAINICPNVNTGYYRWQAATVNLQTGVVDLKGDNLRPANTHSWTIIVNDYASVDKTISPYFISEKGIVKVDLTSGEQKVLSSVGLAKMRY